MNASLCIMLNGEQRELADVSAGVTLTELVAALGLKADRIAVELNGDIARRSGWNDLTVTDGDRLEVVHFVGGGSFVSS